MTDTQRKSIAATPKKETDATRHLAQGAATENSEDFITALALYIENDALEANKNIQRILSDNIPTGSVQARAAYDRAQIKKWENIFTGNTACAAQVCVAFVESGLERMENCI